MRDQVPLSCHPERSEGPLYLAATARTDGCPTFAAFANVGLIPKPRTFPLPKSLSSRGILSAIAFHEKAGRSQVGSFVFSLDKVFSPPELLLSPPFHPHSSRSDFVRSVPVGCSRFSRCCHLIFDLAATM